jgi:hypothetical protein
MKKRIDAIQRALKLRETIIQDGKVLVADFSDTLQGKDTSKVIDLMPDVGTGNYVFRAKVNVKNIDPIAAEKYGVSYVNVNEMGDADVEGLLKKQEFDFPLWYKHNDGFNMKRVGDFNIPFIMQVAGCNFHDGTKTGGCWYCFVDDVSNDGVKGNGKSFLDARDAVESMVQASAKVKDIYANYGLDLNMRTFRTSGGEPTIALDWMLDAWRNISERGLNFVGQLDSNLSTGPLVDEFEKIGVYEKNTLEQLGEFPIKVLTALKGTDGVNIQNNVQSTTSMDNQLYSIKRFLGAGFDIYPQLYNPNPKTLERYLGKLDSEIENISLRVHIGPLKLYGPNRQRLEYESLKRGIDSEEFIQSKVDEWDSNYKAGNEIIDSYLRRVHGVGYKELVRSDIPLRILKK